MLKKHIAGVAQQMTHMSAASAAAMFRLGSTASDTAEAADADIDADAGAIALLLRRLLVTIDIADLGLTTREHMQ